MSIDEHDVHDSIPRSVRLYHPLPCPFPLNNCGCCPESDTALRPDLQMQDGGASADLAPYHVSVPAHLAGRRLWRAEPAVLLLAGQRAGPRLGRFPHDAVSGAGHAVCVGQLLSDRLRRAERHLPEHAVRLHLAVAGSDGAAVRHHSVQDEIPGLDRAGVLGLQLFDGQLRHQGQPRAGAGGFSGVLWPRGR